MGKELITIEMERDSLQQKWGFTVQGGKDVSLTAKIASGKVMKSVGFKIYINLYMLR